MKIIHSILICFFTFSLVAQVDKIHVGDGVDHEAAILQADAIDRGFLIPRMTTLQRNAILSPERGMLVYDLDNECFWVYSTSSWLALPKSESATSNKISDVDGDTFIQALDFGNVNKIVFKVKGNEKIELKSDTLKMNGGNHLLVGASLNGAGSKFFIREDKKAIRAGSISADQWDYSKVGYGSLAAGLDNEVSGIYSAGWGENNVIDSWYSVAFGKNNDLGEGSSSFVWGLNNDCSFSKNIAWGSGNESSSVAFGTTNGTSSSAVAWGTGNEANLFGSIAFGYVNEAERAFATAWGELNIASGEYSTAFGYNGKAQSYAETVFGTYPLLDSQANSSLFSPKGSDRVFVIGKGLSLAERSNAMEILKYGRTRLWGNYQNIVGNAESAALKFLEGSENPNDDQNQGFQFIYDGSPDILTLERVDDGGGITEITTWKKDGKMGIGREPIDYILEVNGTAAKSTPGNWIANSDKRLKKNIEFIDDEDALSKVLLMRGVFYHWNDDVSAFIRPTTRQIGFIAQELEHIFPSKIVKDSKGFLLAAYGKYDAIYAQAFKEQDVQLNIIQDGTKDIERKVADHQQLHFHNVTKLEAIKSNIKMLEFYLQQ